MIHEIGTGYPVMGQDGREIVSLTIPSFEMLPGEIALHSPHFVCLLCSDARGISDRAIIDAATALLAQGLVYLCTWGPDCNRVRQLFETAALLRHSRAVMQAVHLCDDFDDALDYALNVASPTMDYKGTCQTSLILTVGRADWSQPMQRYLNEAGVATFL